MRPSKPLHLQIGFDRQAEGQSDEFEEALNQFIEAVVRAEVSRLRLVATASESEGDKKTDQ